MPVCEICGKSFDIKTAEQDFDSCRYWNYSNVRNNVCGKCANDAVNSGEDNILFFTCDNCGTEFCLFEEAEEFFSNVFDDLDFHGDLMSMWHEQCLCCACALDKLWSSPAAPDYDEEDDE